MASQVVDLEEVLKTWAWNAFLKTATKKVKYEDVKLKVIWDRLNFTPSEPDFRESTQLSHPSSTVIFESTFKNTTDREQEHSLKAERTTTITSQININKGYTKGINVGLELSVPGDVVKATAAFGRQVTVQKAEGSTNEKVLTWSTDDTIKVKPRTKLTAKVEVAENEYACKFTTNVSIKGKVTVIISNPRDNDSFLQSVDGDIVTILKETKDLPTTAVTIHERTHESIWSVEGSCNFRYGISQSIHLSEQNL